MKNIRMLIQGVIIALAVGLPALSAAAAPETYDVDTVHSSVDFKVRHMGIGTVRGTFDEFSGAIVVDKKNPSKSSVEFKVSVTSVNTRNAKRDEHLRSNDFFDVEKYQEMSFKSKKVRKIDKDTVEVTGDFTLHGVTKPLTVRVDILGEGKDHNGVRRIGFETEFTIQRSKFGMNKMIPVAGDKVQVSLLVEGLAAEKK